MPWVDHQVFEPGDVAYIKFLEAYQVSHASGTDWAGDLLRQVSAQLVPVASHITGNTIPLHICTAHHMHTY